MRDILLVLCCFVSIIYSFPSDWDEDIYEKDEADLTVLEFLLRRGYPGEKHSFYTKDRYLLTVYRIPFGLKCGIDEKRKLPVFLQHGLMRNAMDFLVGGQNKGLGFLLADNCFDVWLGNSRGNPDSDLHKDLFINQTEYWQFSFQELGQIDLFAVINYITKTTKQQSIHYIGHSEGVTQFFVFASMTPIRSKRQIKSVHGLAPAVYTENVRSPLLVWASQNLDHINELQLMLGGGELNPQPEVREWLESICLEEVWINKAICSNLAFLYHGYNAEFWDKEALSLLINRQPAMTSVQQIIHCAQLIKSGSFRKYDHGEEFNTIIYGKNIAPEFPIKRINNKIFLWYGGQDWLSATSDVIKMINKTARSQIQSTFLQDFNNFDFIIGMDVAKVIYEPLIQNLNSFEE